MPAIDCPSGPVLLEPGRLVSIDAPLSAGAWLYVRRGAVRAHAPLGRDGAFPILDVNRAARFRGAAAAPITIETIGDEAAACVMLPVDPEWRRAASRSPIEIVDMSAAAQLVDRALAAPDRLRSRPRGHDVEAGPMLRDLLAAAPLLPARRAIRARGGTHLAHERLAEAALRVIAECFGERLTIDLIAKRIHSSPYHLSRVFTRLVGASMHRHLLRTRLARGLEMVVAGPRGLTAIALACGFSSHSHFTTAFVREFGVQPRQLRASQAEALESVIRHVAASRPGLAA